MVAGQPLQDAHALWAIQPCETRTSQIPEGPDQFCWKGNGVAEMRMSQPETFSVCFELSHGYMYQKHRSANQLDQSSVQGTG